MINKYPTLYSFRRCPYAMRARLALRLCKIQCIIREISLKAKHSEFLKVSPKATVPVLVLPNGEVLEESLDIIYWSLEQNDPYKLKINNQLANKTDKLIELIDTEFKIMHESFKKDLAKYVLLKIFLISGALKVQIFIKVIFIF